MPRPDASRPASTSSEVLPSPRGPARNSSPALRPAATCSIIVSNSRSCGSRPVRAGGGVPGWSEKGLAAAASPPVPFRWSKAPMPHLSIEVEQNLANSRSLEDSRGKDGRRGRVAVRVTARDRDHRALEGRTTPSSVTRPRVMAASTSSAESSVPLSLSSTSAMAAPRSSLGDQVDLPAPAVEVTVARLGLGDVELRALDRVDHVEGVVGRAGVREVRRGPDGPVELAVHVEAGDWAVRQRRPGAARATLPAQGERGGSSKACRRPSKGGRGVHVVLQFVVVSASSRRSDPVWADTITNPAAPVDLSNPAAVLRPVRPRRERRATARAADGRSRTRIPKGIRVAPSNLPVTNTVERD